MKYCSKCNELKALNCFYNEKRVKDGKRSACIDCEKKRLKNYVKNNPDKRKKTLKNYANNNREKLNKYQNQWRKNNPKKVKEQIKRRDLGKIKKRLDRDKEKIRARALVLLKIDRDNLGDHYIKQLLKGQGLFINKETIDIKRTQIKIYRHGKHN